MYSNKKNVLELVALLQAHGIDHIVLSPGSRNSPLIHTFSQLPDFRCFSIVDERSAAYFALGLILKLHRPVAICCTSGSALLNYGSAVSEAFYQQLPLLVISADRPLAWLGQLDGQMIPQTGVFGSMCRKSVQLPEITTPDEAWFCNRLINEAVLSLTDRGNAPAHINIPISEPLYEFTVSTLPKVRSIHQSFAQTHWDGTLQRRQLTEHAKCWILVGQLPFEPDYISLLERVAAQYDALIVCEHLANLNSNAAVTNMDALLFSLEKEESKGLAPELLITFGGHIVSKRTKQFLRAHKPSTHIHVDEHCEVVDPYESLTDVVRVSPKSFLESLLTDNSASKAFKYASEWNVRSKALELISEAWCQDAPFADLSVVWQILKQLPANSSLHLANSSSVRNALLFGLPVGTAVYCNRGVSGIDGSVSTAVGYSCIHDGLTFLIVGDLSFFYDINSLWNKYITPNLRIVLINNSGGGIFGLIPGANKSEAFADYISCNHHTQAKSWAQSVDLTYHTAHNADELNTSLREVTNPNQTKAQLLEVFTTAEINTSVFKAYYHHLKTTEHV